MDYSGKVVLVTGGTRGIGKAIALRLGAAGAHIALVGKTATPHPKLEGTIYTAAEEIQKVSSGKVLPIQGDIRMEESIRHIVATTVQELGGIDILVNNASAISLTPTAQTEMKRWDLMHSINVRGTFFMCKECLPHLLKSDNPHILNLSPPLNMQPGWFAPHLAYTMSKYGMSMVVLGLAEEWKKEHIAVNALWPQTTIATAAVQNLLGGDFLMQRSRKPEIVADAAFYILKRPSAQCTGHFFIDEEVLKAEGVTDFTPYAVNPAHNLMKDLFLWIHTTEDLKLEPGYWTLYYYAGKTRDKQGRYQEALPYLDKVLVKKTDEEGVLFNLALYYTNLGQFDKGLDYFNKLLTIQPGRADVYRYMGLIYKAQGDAVKAESYLKKARALGSAD